MKANTVLAITMMVVAFAGSMFWYFYILDHRKVDTVHFFIPAGYRGVFTVEESINGNTPLYGKAADGTAIVKYFVPTSGVVLVNDLEPLKEWHEVSAVFMDGTPLPVYGSQGFSSTSQSHSVLVRGLGTRVYSNGKSEIRYFVGTSAEFEQFRQTSEGM